MDTLQNPPARVSDRAAPPAASVLHVRIAVKELGLDPAHLIGSCACIEPTTIAGAPDLVGLLSFEGRRVPVIDLRVRYGLPAASPGPLSRTLILHIDSHWIGLVVDAVFGVIDLRDDELRPSPGCDAVDDSGCINGLCKRERAGVAHDVILVDIARLIGRDALARITASTAALTATTEPGLLPA